MRPRIAILSVLLVASAALPAAGVQLTFEQISWLDSSGSGYVSRYSDWGQVLISLSSSDHGMFYSMTVQGVAGYGGFVNIVTDAGGAADWEVRNLPIFYLNSSELDGRLPQGVWFDLGVTPATQVTGLNYYFTIDASPLASMPSGSYSSASVTETTLLLAGTTLWMGPYFIGGGGLAAPQAAMDFPGAESGEVIGAVGRITVPEANVPAVSEDKNGCAPGSTARSIKYLDDTHDSVNVPATPQQVYTGLYGTMKTDADGTYISDILPGKEAYTQSNNLPIMSANTTNFQSAMGTLSKGGDVELVVSWGYDDKGKSLGAHATFVSEIQELQDADGNTTGYVVKTIDDPKQGDGTAANNSHTLKFDANGKLLQYDGNGVAAGAGLIHFMVEQVKMTREDMEFRIGPTSIFPLPPGGSTPPIPLGFPAKSWNVSDLKIYHVGLYDTGNPLNPVGSQLVVNPSGISGATDLLEMELKNVSFTPGDPTAPTILAYTIGLGNLLTGESLYGLLMPMVESTNEALLTSVLATSSFFDVTYQVSMPCKTPQVFHLHGEIAEPLRGKAWLLNKYDLDPDAWVESFFDVTFEIEVTPDAYELLGMDTILINLQMYAETAAGPETFQLFADGDGDGDVDQEDFGSFQRCFTGVSDDLTEGCECQDRDGDGKVNAADYVEFNNCFTGANIPFDPAVHTSCYP